MFSLRNRVLLICAGALAGAGLASAGPYSSLVVFGDSLSDDGNAAFIFAAFPSLIPPGTPMPTPPLYTAGRYTDGPDTTPSTALQGVWVEQLATALGLPHPDPAVPHVLNSSLPNGTDFAIAGAQTGTGLADMGSQVSAFLSEFPGGVSSTSLYALFGGANDLYNSTDPVVAATLALTNIEGEIGALYSAGARDFLFPNLPDLGLTPRGAAGPDATALSTASLDFAKGWAAYIAGARAAGLNITGVNLYSTFQQILASPGSFGFVNATTPAQGQSVDPNKYLFWDLQHPTTAGHAQIADAALNALGFGAVTTPEPSSLLLCATGLACLIAIIRRKSNKQA